jgi:hypothetical protein
MIHAIPTIKMISIFPIEEVNILDIIIFKGPNFSSIV